MTYFLQTKSCLKLQKVQNHLFPTNQPPRGVYYALAIPQIVCATQLDFDRAVMQRTKPFKKEKSNSLYHCAFKHIPFINSKKKNVCI
jgi:hypothetical protein